MSVNRASTLTMIISTVGWGGLGQHLKSTLQAGFGLRYEDGIGGLPGREYYMGKGRDMYSLRRQKWACARC